MNLLIETLNVWADNAPRLAWPMLWQSSLLIGVLFALDWLLRRTLRAAVRYALWLVVLVKLLLPPSLALPTSAGWWLRPAKAAPVAPRPASVVVTYGANDRPVLPSASIPVFVAPSRPRLSPAAWALLGMTAVSIGFLAAMVARWLQVVREVRRAPLAPAGLNQLLPESRRPVRLRLTDHPQSPAVCGLFRPVILLPRSLAKQLPPAQLRAVLLHELFHLRRGDVWVNCAQALMQIAYWWHPLLWLANARIRRVREEAVDDAVMLALNEDAENYAPTLLEVAKLALQRPQASLGLVGILESRSSLRQRIERLLDFHPPRKAGLGLAAALGVLSFAALAVPMGEAPAPTTTQALAVTQALTNDAVSQASSNAASPSAHPQFYVRSFKIATNTLIEGLQVAKAPGETNGMESLVPALIAYLARAGVDVDPATNPGKALFYTYGQGLLMVRATLQDLDTIERELAKLKVAPSQINAAAVGEAPQIGTNSPPPRTPSGGGLKLDKKARVRQLVQDGKLLYEMNRLDEAEAKLKEALKEDPQNQPALYYLNLVSEAKYERAHGHPKLLVPNPYSRTNLVQASPGRHAIISKLDRIRLESVSFEGLPLSQVLRSLSDEVRKRDPEKLGINFVLTHGTSTNTAGEGDLFSLPIRIQPPLTNIRLADVLDVLVKVAGSPIKYSIEDYAVVFSERSKPESPPLYVRTFKVDPNTLLENLHVANGRGGTNGPAAVVAALRERLAKQGVDMDPLKSPGQALFYNDRQGKLVVRGTLQDLDLIEAEIAAINTAPPQINIKCKFVEISQGDTKALGFDWYLGNMLMTSSPTGGQIGTAPFPNGGQTAANPVGVLPGKRSARTNDQRLNSSPRLTGSQPATLTGILTDPQYRVVLKALQQREGTEVVAQPEVTTSDGRQAQCKVAEIRSIVKGIDERALTPPGITSTNDDESSVYRTESMEFGLTLDITPTVLPDGYTVNVPLIVSLFEFLGYEEGRTNQATVYVNGKQKQVSPPQPIVRACQITSQANVQDGQTLVLGGLVSERIITMKNGVPVLGDLPLVGPLFRSQSTNTRKRDLLVFITPTIIDPAGNRVHATDETPPAPKGVASRPPR